MKLKLIEELTCEHCLYNTPGWNGWCTLHSMNTFKLGLTSCSRCNMDKLEFKDACSDYKAQPAAPPFPASDKPVED